MTDVYNIDFRSWTLGGQVSPWLALKPLSQVCWPLMLYQTSTYLYGQICESQICPSGVSPNIERLCFSGNRDALLDSHLSTLGEHIDTVKSPSGPVLTLSSSSGDRCRNLKELDVSDSTKLTALTIATVRASIWCIWSWTLEIRWSRKCLC